MGYLGSYPIGNDLILRVVWTPFPGDTVSGSTATIIHEDGTTIEATGTLAAPNTFTARVSPGKAGNWEVHWVTDPVGGSTEDRFYVEP